MNIELSLRDGRGDLMTRASADAGGPANYAVKRDWRTELDQEVRREGDRVVEDGLFATLVTTAKIASFTASYLVTGAGFPCTPPGATLIATMPDEDLVSAGWYALFSNAGGAYTVSVRRDNGEVLATLNPGQEALVVWDGAIFVVVTERTFPAALTLIFTARKDNGKSGLIVGTPSTLYRHYALESKGVLEAGIVEAGIVGTIAVTNGQWITIGSGFATASTYAHRWEAKNVGGLAVFNNGCDLPVTYELNEFAVQPLYELREQGVAFVGTIEEIAGILVCCDVAQIHEDYLRSVMEAIGYGGFCIGQESHYDRVHYLVMWGDPVSVLRWGASVPAAIAAGTRTLVLGYEMASFKPGDAIRVVGAGVDGADLLTTLGYHSAASTWIITDEASTTVLTGATSKQDAATLIAGSYPLLDDASPILRAIKTQDRLLIAKSTGFILGDYTGDRALPFTFQRVYSGQEGLFWRWTMIEMNGAVLYAGKGDFYTFDLISRMPKQHPRLTLCANLFFEAVAGAAQDDVFASDNGLTKEIWFHFPSADADKALAYDYRKRELGGDRCQTIGAAYGATGMVDKPAAAVAHGSSEQWFLVATAAGLLLQYAFDRTGPVLWTRQDVGYNSDLWPGIADFGDAMNEKHLKQYLLLLASQSPNNSIQLGLWGVRNPGEAMTELAGSPVTFATPQTQNTVFLHHLVHLVQERIRVSGTGNVRIARRMWGVGRVGSASAQRR